MHKLMIMELCRLIRLAAHDEDMGKKEKLYLKTTTDDLELPIAVAGSTKELARMLKTTPGAVKSAISHHYGGWHRIIIEEGEEDE